MNIIPNSEGDMPSLASFILTVCDVTAELPFEVIPRVFLRKPSILEREYISGIMNRTRCDHVPAIFHEAQWLFQENGWGLRSEPDPGKWRYYVLEFPNPQNHKLDPNQRWLLQLAALVSEPQLRWAITTMKDPPRPHASSTATGGMVVWLEHEFERIKLQRSIRAVSEQDLIDWKQAIASLWNLEPAFQFIIDAIVLYQASFDIHPTSRLRVLALFAVIELLVTHKPKGTDTGDSLIRQVRNKLKLLSNRFSTPMHPSDRFDFQDNEVAWDVIYNYRSLIAHGGSVDFETAYRRNKHEHGAAQLGNDQQILFFLDEFTRRLVRHALKEPSLMADLKDC
jgi:hypothetical protein